MQAAKTLSVLAYLFLVAALVYLWSAHSLFANSSPGIAVQIFAALLMIGARVTFGRRSFHLAANPTAGELVTDGPYRFVRHPIYSSILLFILASVVSHRSLRTLAVGLLVFGALLVRVLSEEKFLRKRYPEYSKYAAKTARLIPFVL